MTDTIGFIGLGIMGQPMALNLLRAGHALAVHARREQSMAPLAEAGAETCPSPAEVARRASVVFTMVADTPDVEQVILGPQGVIEGVGPDSLIVDMSTIAPSATRAIAARLREAGADMLDAPVSGGVAAAAAGTLAFMCGGAAETFDKARLILADMGKNIFHAGPAGAGQVAKGCNNMLLAIHMIGTCEALEMGARNGLDPAVLSEIMLASSGRNWSLEVYNPYPGVMEGVPAGNGYQPGFMVDLMVKDLGLAMEIAEGSGVHNAMGQLARQLYAAHQESGSGQRDFSSILERLQS